MRENDTKLPDDAEPFARKSLDETAKLLLRSLILINGGAAVAVLAFAGNVLSHTSPGIIGNAVAVASPLGDFSFGVGFAVLAMAFSYFSSNYEYLLITALMDEQELTKGDHIISRVLFSATMICTLTSLGLFFVGVSQSVTAITAFVK